MSCFIIAEAGVNHNGSIELAKQLIVEAKRIGADAVKFQSFKADKLVSKNAIKADYQKLTSDPNESQYRMIKQLELSESDHMVLMDFCRKEGIMFLSSPFDEESAKMLIQMGLNVLKIPSGEITNTPFLKFIAKLKCKVILSTGMSTIGEVEDAVDVLLNNGATELTLLHCVTEYPAPYDQINLKAMLTLKAAFGLKVGYSDHTEGIEVPIAAVALGAEIIEKHFTLDKSLPGPDHKASLNPEEFEQMIQGIRNVEVAMGDGIKKPKECEFANRRIGRKSIVASSEIRTGERFTAANISIKRPGNGISPKFFDWILGKYSTRYYEKDELIQLDNNGDT